MPKQGGAHVSITSFRIPASNYAVDPAIRESVAEVFQALALGDPRHGSNYVSPPEEEIPLNHRIGTATGSWDSAWVDSCGEEEATLADKDWIAFIRWERPQFETPFKARKNRHFNIRLGKLNGIGGVDVQDLLSSGWWNIAKNFVRGVGDKPVIPAFSELSEEIIRRIIP